MSDVTLDVFLRRLASVNPFLENRVNGRAPEGVDVAGIHQRAFECITGLARQVHSTQSGLGCVLWGEAGIGKSHLLARLERWSRTGHARFVYLHNLQASPDALPRSLLHAVVSVLTKGRRDRLITTPLSGMVRAALIEAAGSPSRYPWAQLELAWKRWVDSLQPATGNASLYDVLYAFFRSAAKTALGKEDGKVACMAVRWLAGGALDPDEARSLGLPPARHRDEPVALEDGQPIKEAMQALARLAQSEGLPMILALDQVDNLDVEQFASLTRFLEALLDSAPNVLVVTAGVQATLSRWFDERIVQASAWDRVAQFKFQLENLTPEQAGLMIRARIKEFLLPYADVEEVIEWQQADPFFPLGKTWMQQQFGDRVEIRPRDVISLAREGWQAQQEKLARVGSVNWVTQWPGEDEPPKPKKGTPPALAREQAVTRELDALRTRLLTAPAQITSDADRLAGLLYDLFHLTRSQTGLDEVARHPPPRRGAPPTYHLTLKQKVDADEHVTGVLVMSTGAATAVAGFLRRLCEDGKPLDRVVIVTDERVGMPLGERGREYLEDLQTRGKDRFEVFQLHFAELLELEILGRVLGRASAQDIEIASAEGELKAMTPEEVSSSGVWRKRFTEHRLVATLLSPLVVLSPL
jgi:hypothetical protein